MLKNIIYYFSGTGNSYYVAKSISNNIGAQLKSILSINRNKTIEADILGFVFPVYESKPPKLVTEIIRNLTSIKANYIFAITTYGVALSSSLLHFNKTLNEKGSFLSMGYRIKSPQNAVGSTYFTDEENNLRILNSDKKLINIIQNIKNKKITEIEKTTIFEDMTLIKEIPYILKLVFILIFKGSKALQFKVTNDCIKCYQCVKFCSVNNIYLSNETIRFKDKCVACFGCIQWCPKSAINIGKYSFEELNIKKYHHPKVKIEELFNDENKEKI